ncbi:hypothetical protein [Rhizobium mayense]|uniref:Uncharacterized protein n=1 Tax=Rhizobium mayense TaxID=1312184 RepID=A0ABT7K460_9HYPH|nr:hypothetical protein [Rhizobium mayense]MDL2402932.1 hypothetical protein [Rhizobium mayense]
MNIEFSYARRLALLARWVAFHRRERPIAAGQYAENYFEYQQGAADEISSRVKSSGSTNDRPRTAESRRCRRSIISRSRVSMGR